MKVSLYILSIIFHHIESLPPLLLLISFDGFRYDFLNPNLAPHIWQLANNGVYAPNGIRSQATTLTLPNHQCIATGLYEESHGLIDNIFYDPVIGDSFDLWNFMHNATKAKNSRLSHWFNGASPIWRQNMQIKGQKSGCLNWPACDAQYEDKAPVHKFTVWESPGNFDTWKTEIDQMINWFKDPDQPINLGLYYNAEPDDTEHLLDIFSDDVKSKIGQLDNLVGYLLKKLNESDLLDHMNLILTSDHGFVNVWNESFSFDLSTYVDPKLVIQSGQSFFPRSDLNITVDEIYANLTKAKNDALNILFWRKEDFPDKYHWKNNRRVGPIIVFNALHYVNEPEYFKDFHSYPYGTHTFLNDDSQMRPFFVASGPSFKQGYKISNWTEIENVDIFPLMSKILGLELAPNNGSFERIKQILKNSSNGKWTIVTNVFIFVAVFFVIVQLVS